MKRLSIAAILIAVASLGVSGWALSRSYDTPAVSSPGSTTTTVRGGGSATEPLVVVPSVVNRNSIAAAVVLEDAKLTYKVVRATSPSVAEDRVISQNPLQGTEVPEGTVIELTISSGPR